MKRALRSVLSSAERGVRQLLVPSWRRHRLGEEDTLRRVLQLLDVDCVFDVGANFGGYGIMLRENCGYSGRIMSFEPTPDVFAELLGHTSRDGLWDAPNFALGGNEGSAKRQVHRASMGASFLSVQEGDAGSTGNAIVQ